MQVPITIWYVILGLSTVALVAVGVAIFLRIRRLSRASETQFQRIVDEESGTSTPAVKKGGQQLVP